MFGSRQFNTRQFNHAEMIIPPPLADMVFAGYAPTIPFVHIQIEIPVATMTLTAPELVGFGPVTITVPVATMEWQQQGLDLVQILAHYIHRSKYPSLPRLINRVYVIGIDSNGNNVYGEAKDSTDIAEYGEVLYPYLDSMITSTANATSVAANILAKARLTVPRGTILVNPHCGMEIWDAIQLADTIANQTAANYRVAGWAFTYDTQQGQYQHEIQLTSI